MVAHQDIYHRHPAVQAIVFAHPVNATGFSVTGACFDAGTIPESYVFLRDVADLPMEFSIAMMARLLSMYQVKSQLPFWKMMVFW